MIRYLYKGSKYLSLYEIRQKIYKDIGIAFGDWDNELKTRFGIIEEEYNPEDEMTDEELASRVRMRRDSLISRTDFYVQPDYPSDPVGLEAVKAYRQALRDIPEQSGFPRNVQWPAMPMLSVVTKKVG